MNGTAFTAPGEGASGYIVGFSHADGGDWVEQGSFRTVHAARNYASTLKVDGRWLVEVHALDGSGRLDTAAECEVSR